MSELLTDLPISTEAENASEVEPRVTSFKTARGSIYTYDTKGKTTRYKTAASIEGGHQQEQQDITVFVKMTPQQEAIFSDAIRGENPDIKAKVYVVEQQLDGSPKIVRDVSEIEHPDKLFLAIYRQGKFVGADHASMTPSIGTNVFDSRRFVEDGQEQTERHLGNKVVEISYEE